MSNRRPAHGDMGKNVNRSQWFSRLSQFLSKYFKHLHLILNLVGIFNFYELIRQYSQTMLSF